MMLPVTVPYSQYIFHRWLAVLFFVICIAIVLYSRELGELRGFIGDVIIVMFLYSLIQGIYHITPWKLTIAILALSFSIELLQYFHFVTLMGWEMNPVMRLIFGSVYDTTDLIAYTIGCIVIYAGDTYLFKKEYFSRITS